MPLWCQRFKVRFKDDRCRSVSQHVSGTSTHLHVHTVLIPNGQHRFFPHISKMINPATPGNGDVSPGIKFKVMLEKNIPNIKILLSNSGELLITLSFMASMRLNYICSDA